MLEMYDYKLGIDLQLLNNRFSIRVMVLTTVDQFLNFYFIIMSNSTLKTLKFFGRGPR